MVIVVGVSGAQELTQETTYLETDLNTGDCRNIAVKPKSSATKLQLPESLTVSGGVSSGLHSISQMQRFLGQDVASSQYSLPDKSAAFGYHSAGNTQNVTASGHSASGTTVVIDTHSGNPPVTEAGFPSVTDQKFSSEIPRSEARSGVYSLASSRLLVQPAVSKTGSDAGNWADQRLAADAVVVEGLRDNYQHRQIVSSHRENADGAQQSSDRKQLTADISQVISLVFLYLLHIRFKCNF